MQPYCNATAHNMRDSIKNKGRTDRLHTLREEKKASNAYIDEMDEKG